MSKTPCDLILACDAIIACDDAETIHEQAAIAVAAGKIEAVGPREDIFGGFDAAEVIDLPDSMAMPGLINAHTHASMTLLRGLADDLPLMEWLTKHIWPVEGKLSADHIRLGAQLAFAEMVASGCTCFADMYFHEIKIAGAMCEAGMRCLLGEGVLSFPTPSYTTIDEGFALIEELQDFVKDDPLIKPLIAAHAVYTVERHDLVRSFEFAEEHDLPWTIHLAETRGEMEECLKNHGKRPFEYLGELNLLTDRTLLCHAVHLSNDEIEAAAAFGVKVAHNPESNMKLASGVAPIADMLSAGMVVGLGTDGAASNNNLNMFTEMTTAALMQKAATMDPTSLDAFSVLRMATRGSAACLRLKNVGSILPGMDADIAVLDLSRPNLTPMYNPISHAVFAADGGDVRLTMIAGQVVYRDGQFPTIDYQAVRREALEVARWIKRMDVSG